MAPIDLIGLRCGKSKRKKIWEKEEAEDTELERQEFKKYKKEKKIEAEEVEALKKCFALFDKEIQLMKKQMAEYPGDYVYHFPPLSEADYEAIYGEVHH